MKKLTTIIILIITAILLCSCSNGQTETPTENTPQFIITKEIAEHAIDYCFAINADGETAQLYFNLSVTEDELPAMFKPLIYHVAIRCITMSNGSIIDNGCLSLYENRYVEINLADKITQSIYVYYDDALIYTAENVHIRRNQ